MSRTMCWSVNEAKDEDGKWSQERGGGEREKARRETAMKTLEGEGISVTDSIKG